jgi:hypothetical protein
MIDNMQKVNELEREVTVALHLTKREEQLLEALQFMIDQHYASKRKSLATLFDNYEKEQEGGWIK